MGRFGLGAIAVNNENIFLPFPPLGSSGLRLQRVGLNFTGASPAGSWSRGGYRSDADNTPDGRSDFLIDLSLA